uniref:Uncharacterized protein n=1 Tax=Oryza rufipogon TaxID=4529 RepID=A0A0E0PWF6_ORYRU
MGKAGSIYADSGGFEHIDATSEKTLTTAAAQPDPASMTRSAPECPLLSPESLSSSAADLVALCHRELDAGDLFTTTS